MRNGVRLLIIAALCAAPSAGASAKPQHAIAMHGEPALPANFRRFDYVNPDAPKGGELRLGERGSFDSLNPFSVRGVAPRGVREWVFESLLKRNNNEPFTLYAAVARTVETDAARSWVSFTLDPRAHFSNGAPITIDDVVFSLEALREKGRPNHRNYYKKVIRIERIDGDQVRFHFDPRQPDREMPLILGLMPILSKAWFTGRDLQATSLDAPPGSGPYKIASIETGRSITYVRDPNYWAADLPANRGQYNFDRIRIDYYRDENSAFEAFKAGQFDFHEEQDPARWASGYDIAPVRAGEIILDTLPHGRPSGLLGMAFNTRRVMFQDIRVRRALTHLFDFEWINRNFFYGAYRRTSSLFDNSALAAHGPSSAQERALLAPYAAELSPDILDLGYSPPRTGGSGHNRAGQQQALALLESGGWRVHEGQLVNQQTGAPLTFEILLAKPEQEKLALAYSKAAQRLGIRIAVRTVDSSQYEERLRTYDFDMMIYDWDASLSPGNEQQYYWGSAAADTQGTRNYPGIKSAAVDAMIARLLAAQTAPQFKTAARALDRALMSGNYVIPMYFQAQDRIARQAHLRYPEKPPLYGFDLTTWWDGRPRINDARPPAP